MHKALIVQTALTIGTLLSATTADAQQNSTAPSFEQYIRQHVPDREEIDVFLNELSWAEFDPDVGYILGSYMPRDGVHGSSTLSTVQQNGARTSFLYRGKPCRINTYGNSFTMCHQVSDGETWQEYLAGHLGEPVRNFGMGGFGLYQAYRRMVREERTDHQTEYLMLYIWGDDHIRSLLRCRYMLTGSWNRSQDSKEGKGRMFHGNFWSNIEMNLATGQLEEKGSLLPTRESLFKMADPDWMVDHLKDDFALQMGLYNRGLITDIDVEELRALGRYLNRPVKLTDGKVTRETVAALLDAYSFSATKTILKKAQEFATSHDKKLMVILFDPYRVMRPMLSGQTTRYDQEIVDFLRDNKFRFFDMNVVHADDFKCFNLTESDYMKRYFIGHYSPAGNHFFAYALKDQVIEWLDPKPLPYRETTQKIIDFKGYLQNY